MKTSIRLWIVGLFISCAGYAQDVNTVQPIKSTPSSLDSIHELHNAFLIELSSSGFFTQFGVEYQYFYKPNPMNSGWRYYVSGSAHVGYSIGALFQDGYDFGRATFSWGTTYGRKNNYLDMQVGVLAQNYYEELLVFPNVKASYRYENPRSGVTFRAGLGLLVDGIFIGIGKRF